MLRSILEKCTRNWRFKRRLPQDFKRLPIYVSSAGGLKYLFKSMETIDPQLIHFTKNHIHDGDVVWDVGANVGLFSACASARAGTDGQVYAFEPDTWLVELLRRTSRGLPNHAAAIEVVPAGVAKDIALRRFHVASRARAANHLESYGSTQTGGAREQQTVVTFSMDWLGQNLRAPNVLKIDVEGAEMEVLLGGKETIAKSRPRVLCEVADSNCEQATAFFQDLNYKLYDADVDPDCQTPIGETKRNTIALPE